eukprot:scaffold95102_cov30-Prasinocladus_malaysianus.AAC.1
MNGANGIQEDLVRQAVVSFIVRYGRRSRGESTRGGLGGLRPLLAGGLSPQGTQQGRPLRLTAWRGERQTVQSDSLSW